MNNPYRIDSEPCVVSFSGGRSSGYMLHQIVEAHGGLGPHRAIFANTGKEHEATLDFVHRCAEQWGINIEWVEYTSPDRETDSYRTVSHDTASRNGEPFMELIERRKLAPNPGARFCTGFLKRDAIKWLGGKATTVIGIRADEPRRIGRVRATGALLPMVDARATRETVGRFWKDHPFDLELANDNGVTPWGNCDLCFLKARGRLISLIRTEPHRADWWVKAEARADALCSGEQSHFSVRHTYRDLIAMTGDGDQYEMFDESIIDCYCGD